jgi:hypothetical protein
MGNTTDAERDELKMIAEAFKAVAAALRATLVRHPSGR